MLLLMCRTFCLFMGTKVGWLQDLKQQNCTTNKHLGNINKSKIKIDFTFKSLEQTLLTLCAGESCFTHVVSTVALRCK